MNHKTGDTQRNSSNVSQINFFKLCDNHPVLDSAALFIHKIDNASLSAIHSNVAKFSNLKLSQTHHDLLNLGLSFRPTPRHINPVKVCYDNEQFCNYSSLPILMLLYIMLYIVLAYLMLFAALTNAVCLHNASFFAIDFCKCISFSCFVFVY